MTRFLAAALLLSGALAAQDGKVEMILAAKVPNPKAKRPLLRFDGAAPLPDLAVLFVSVGRSYESFISGRLEPMVSGAGGAMAQVKERKFSLESPIDGPGLFAVRVDLRDELQNPKVVDSLKKSPVQPKIWEFKFSAWGEDFSQTLVSNLQEFDVLAADAAEMVKRYETACKTEEAWKAAAKELSVENGKLLKRCEGSGLRACYPAALNQVHYTVRNLQGNSPYFTFVDGKFTGATSYHADEQKIKTFRDEAFTYENFKRYISESGNIAGREFALWVVKDFRRAGHMLHPDTAEAVKQLSGHVGVIEFAERLKAVKTPEEANLLETDIRGKREGPDKAGPKAPGFQGGDKPSTPPPPPPPAPPKK